MRAGIEFHELAQGSPEWFGVRLGRVTGSTAAPLLVDGVTEEAQEIITKLKKEIGNIRKRKDPDELLILAHLARIDQEASENFSFSDGAMSLVYQLAGEIVTGKPPPSFGNYWTDRGTRLESVAAEAYMDTTFNEANIVGFISMGDYAGCSPDFMVDERRGGEIKCLSAKEHLRYCHTREIEKNYMAQIQWCLFITGFEVWDYVHFHPECGRSSLIIDEIKPDLFVHEKFDKRLPLIIKQIEAVASLAA